MYDDLYPSSVMPTPEGDGNSESLISVIGVPGSILNPLSFVRHSL